MREGTKEEGRKGSGANRIEGAKGREGRGGGG